MMTEENKALVIEMRANANRTGNKRIEEFLRAGATRVNEILLECDGVLAENADLKAKNRDLEEQISAWKALVDSYKIRFDGVSAPVAAAEAVTPERKLRPRFHYAETLREFEASSDLRLKIPCEAVSVDAAPDDKRNYCRYFPSVATFRRNIERLHLPMIVTWVFEEQAIYIFKKVGVNNV